MFTINHMTISVSDFDKSKKFYSKFGFAPLKFFETEDSNMKIGMFELDNMILEIFCFKDNKELPPSARNINTDLPVIGTKHFALGVDSIEEAKQFCETNKIVEKEIDITLGNLGRKYFFIEDPDDILIEIIEKN